MEKTTIAVHDADGWLIERLAANAPAFKVKITAPDGSVYLLGGVDAVKRWGVFGAVVGIYTGDGEELFRPVTYYWEPASSPRGALKRALAFVKLTHSKKKGEHAWA